MRVNGSPILIREMLAISGWAAMPSSIDLNVALSLAKELVRNSAYRMIRTLPQYVNGRVRLMRNSVLGLPNANDPIPERCTAGLSILRLCLV